ncbi:hypothetical protein NFI96_030236 [Prochilodus magdalenae]|nr:hypothetical protein NFI96_030236 [Prochilodus magdalenae]
MAANDSVTEAAQVELSNELLSPSELLHARSRNHKIPVKGQKDFLPTGSEQQGARLQKSLDEHWTLVAEERVERLGNLVNAEWVPEEKLVKLQSPAGKFWQTMGFSDHGKQCLFPEEALYLMECGIVQVLYRDLPLSIQEGYERFLSPGTVTLQQYQVFGHLKRLGYVVNRFDPSTVPSLYERQLNLPLSRDKQSKERKRKRSHSPGSRQHEKQSAVSVEETAPAGECGEAPDLLKTEQTPQDESMESCTDSETGPGRHWWTDTPSPAQHSSGHLAAPRWDFSCILFPDLGSKRAGRACLSAPDSKLLPGALQVGDCEVTPWLRKLNLKQERLSRREREKQRERDRYHRDINDDREVRCCRNWAEYLQLLEKRRSQRHRKRPAHLWEQDITPLTHPGQYDSHRGLLEKVGIIKSSDLLEGASSFDGPVPDLRVMKQLSFQSGDVPVTFAVVDHGDISFYCFKEFKLPTDIY